METRTRQFLVEERRQWVDDRTCFGHRLTAGLKLYYLQALDWFDDVTAPITLEWLERRPTLEKLQKARPATIEQFLLEHGRRDADKIQTQLQQIQQARPAVTDAAVIDSSLLKVQSLVGQLKLLREAIAGYDRRLESLVQSHPDFAIVDSLPGAGPAMAPRLIAVLGTQRDRFEDASSLQCFSGIAPVTSQSGRQSWVHWRWACPKFARQTFHEWAQHYRIPNMTIAEAYAYEFELSGESIREVREVFREVCEEGGARARLAEAIRVTVR